jgi:hypothetical protein
MTEATTKAAVLTKRGIARTRAGHPWIYRLLRAEADDIPPIITINLGGSHSVHKLLRGLLPLTQHAPSALGRG